MQYQPGQYHPMAPGHGVFVMQPQGHPGMQQQVAGMQHPTVAQPAMAPAGGGNLNVDDALSYLEEVRSLLPLSPTSLAGFRASDGQCASRNVAARSGAHTARGKRARGLRPIAATLGAAKRLPRVAVAALAPFALRSMPLPRHPRPVPDPALRCPAIALRPFVPSGRFCCLPPQVKREFEDDDAVYNQFLEIMKNFKAQT